MRPKVFVIIMDGACFERLLPWMEQGELPHLESMMKQGVSGDLESTVPPFTAPAVSSLITGKNPGGHGIYDFMNPVEGAYKYQPVHSHARRGKTIWEILGEEGKRVVLLNVPTTYPPKPVNGTLISDFLTPESVDDFTYPRSLGDEIQKKFGPYPLFLAPPLFLFDNFDSEVHNYIDKLSDVQKYKFRVAHYLLEKVDPDFLLLHIYGNDPISHWLWHIFDRTHPRFSERTLEKHGPKILEYYKEFDSELGNLIDRMDSDTSLIVMSDHGFGPMQGIFDVNTWLLKEGYTVLKRGPTTKLRFLLWKRGFTSDLILRWLVKLGVLKFFGRSKFSGTPRVKTVKPSRPFLLKLLQWIKRIRPLLLKMLPFLSIKDVDWSRTKAFGGPGFGHIYINLKGKYPRGCVSAEDCPSLSEEIASRLREIIDPRTGRRINARILTKDDIYHGDLSRLAPDITFLPMKARYFPRCYLGFRSRNAFSDFFEMTGLHKMNGILVAKGRHFEEGLSVEDARIIDLAPTILYRMGLKVPRDMDGRVLEEIFTEDFRCGNPLEYCEESTDRNEGGFELSPEEQKDIIQKLRGLGYLG